MNSVPTIGITLGDPAGVGPEVTAKALASGRVDPRCQYRVLGSAAGHRPGWPDKVSAKAALDSLRESVSLLRSRHIVGVVTAPISKAGMAGIGFNFPGQTEFYADAFAVSDYAMLLTGPQLTVALVTIHVALTEVPKLLNTDEIIRVGKLLFAHLQRRGLPHPRIAVAGLNPHAGEAGRMGREEIEIIKPAVDSLNQAGTHFYGPQPPDTLFRRAWEGKYDAVLCMYHDQGLIPLKLLDFDKAVNITLGLPIPRTSPDHGTAFDIAGQGIAKPDSMIEAINLAAQLALSPAKGAGAAGSDNKVSA